MSPRPPEESRVATAGVLVSALALHAALLFYYLPRRLFAGGQPIGEIDYSLHAYQVDRALSSFAEARRLWSYDPFCLAGQPANAVEDLTSKSLELFVLAATRLGVGRWAAFNAYILTVHVAVPVVAWASARLFGFGRLRAAIATLLWVLLWHFDSFLHWCWYVGMVSWAAASLLVVLVVALCYRAFEDHERRHYVLLVAAAATVCLVHPFAVMTLALPLAALYAARFRSLSVREHGALLGGVLLSAATTLVWVGPAVALRDGITRIDDFLWPGARYVLFDWLDLIADLLMTGEPVRTGFRTASLVLAGLALASLARSRDRRALPMMTLIVGSFLLAYGTGYVPFLRQTQPYRQITAVALTAGLAAAHALPDVLSRASLSGLKPRARVALYVAALVAVPQLARTVLQYLPTLVPRQLPATIGARPGPADDGSNLEPDPVVMGYATAPGEYARVSRHLVERFSGKGRVAVPLDWVLGEYLATFSGLPVLGGIPQRNVPQVAAHPMRHDLRPSGPDDDPFARYLEQYAVAAVVTNAARGPIDDRLDVLELTGTFGAYRVYSVKHAASYFAQGEGRVVAQKLNSITVSDAAGPEVVLRFHWLRTLRCRPDCTVERAPADRDSAGFLRIRNPPSRFEIYNAYL